MRLQQLRSTLAVLIVGILATSAQAVFVDTFDIGYTPGQAIPGTNGWERISLYGYASPSLALIGSAGSGVGVSQGWVTSGLSADTFNAGRNITGDVIGTTYTVSMAVNAPIGTPPITDPPSVAVTQAFLAISDAATMLTGGVSVAPDQHIMVIDSNSNHMWFDLDNTAGAGFGDTLVTYASLGFNPNTAGWFEVKMDMDTSLPSGANTQAFYRDIDDITGLPIGLGTWNSIGFFPGPVGHAVQAAGGWAITDARIDNFVSGVPPIIPEPASLTLMGLGGLLLLRIRQRRPGNDQ